MIYKDATIEEIATKFKTMSRQAVSAASRYYIKNEDFLTFEKIEKAKILLKQWVSEERLSKKLEKAANAKKT